MGHKSVCVSCKVAFSNGNGLNAPVLQNCPQCSGAMVCVNQKFKPPKKTDAKGWKIVTLLLENGFSFDAAYEQIDSNLFAKVKYPTTWSEAEEFVKLYKER